MTWGTAGGAGPREAGRGGMAVAGGTSACCAFPQRAHVGAVAGFMLPQNGQRV